MKIKYMLAAAVVSLLASEYAFASDTIYRPIVVKMTSGTLNADVSNKIIKDATDAVSEATLASLAQASYATDPVVFPKAEPFRGQVDLLFHTLKRIDAGMSERISRIQPTSGGKRDLNFQLYWTAKDLGTAPVPGEMGELLVYLLTQNQVVPPEKKKQLELAQLGLRTRVIDGNANVISALKVEAFEQFSEITTFDTGLSAFPLHFDISLTIDSQKGVNSTTKFVFALSGVEQKREDMGTAILDKMVYAPYRQGRGVIEFSMSRFYPFGKKENSDPEVLAHFGQIRRGEMSPNSCVADECLRWVDALPTMYMSINPQTNSWFTRTQAWIASFDHFEMMIRKLGINLATMTMSPQNSELLFVVDAYTGGKKVIDMSKAKPRNWFEYFAQRQGAIEGEILPKFDEKTRETLDDMMAKNLDSLMNHPAKK